MCSKRYFSRGGGGGGGGSRFGDSINPFVLSCLPTRTISDHARQTELKIAGDLKIRNTAWKPKKKPILV